MSFSIITGTNGFINNAQRGFQDMPRYNNQSPYTGLPGSETFFRSALQETSYGLENCISYDLSLRYRCSHNLLFSIGVGNDLQIQYLSQNTNDALSTSITENWMGETGGNYTTGQSSSRVLFDVVNYSYDSASGSYTIPTSPSTFYMTGSTSSYNQRIPTGSTVFVYHYGSGNYSGFTATVTNFTLSNSAYTLSYVENYGTGTFTNWDLREYAWYEIDEINLSKKEPPSYPTCQPNYVTILTNTGATLEGYVNAYGDSTMVTFEYQTGYTFSSPFSSTAIESPITGTITTYVHTVITGLTPNKTYIYRIKVVNSYGTTYSRYTRTFTTPIT